MAKVGLLMTPVQQAQEASGTTHLFSWHSADDNARIAITKTLKMGPAAIKNTGAPRWQGGRGALRASEHEKGNPHRSMQSDVARVLAGKRLLLLDELVREPGSPNVDEVTTLTLSGRCRRLALFSPRPRREASSFETLWCGVKAIQRTVVDSVRPSGDDELDATVTKTTTGPGTEKQRPG